MNFKKLLPLLGIVLTTLLFSCQKDNPDQAALEANATAEQIESKATNSEYYAISYKGRYLSHENGKYMTMNRKKIGPWEKFKITYDGGRLSVVQGSNGKFIREVNTKYGKRLKCDASRKDARRFFHTSIHNIFKFDGFTIRDWDKKKIIAGAGTSSVIGANSIATSKPVKKKYYAFKGSNGKFLSSEDGKKAMTVNRNKARAWEKFEVIKIKSRGTLYKLKCNNGKFVIKIENKLFCRGTKRNADIMSDLFDNFSLRTRSNLGGLKIIKLK